MYEKYIKLGKIQLGFYKAAILSAILFFANAIALFIALAENKHKKEFFISFIVFLSIMLVLIIAFAIIFSIHGYYEKVLYFNKKPRRKKGEKNNECK